MATYDLEAYKREYVELCQKHGFEISACGCCGSPWIIRLDGKVVDEDRVPDVPLPEEVVQEIKAAKERDAIEAARNFKME